MGRSPQKVAFNTNSVTSSQAPAATEDEAVGRSSVDSSAIFSIYSMYGSAEGGASSASFPAVPQRQSVLYGGRRESQGPSPLSSSSYNASNAQQSTGHTNTAPPWASHSVSGHYSETAQEPRQRQSSQGGSRSHTPDAHHQQQQYRQRNQEDRTAHPQFPAVAAWTSEDERDSNFKLRSSIGITATAAHSFSPPSSYHPTTAGVNGNQTTPRSSQFPPAHGTSSYHQRNISDDYDDDDESLALEIELGSTVAGGSNPASPTTPTFRAGSMSFLSSPSKQEKKSKRDRVKSTASTASRSELAYFDSGIMPSVPAPRPPSSTSANTSRAPSALSGAFGAENRGFDSKRSSRVDTSANGRDGVDDFSSNGTYNGGYEGSMGKNNNRMSMSNWLPDPTFSGSLSIPTNLVADTTITQDLYDAGGAHPASRSQLSLHQQAVAASSQRESQPPPSLSPGGTSPQPQSLHHTLSNGSHYHSSRSSSPSVSVYATPLTAVSPASDTILGSATGDLYRSDSQESGAQMSVNNRPSLKHHASSLASSRRGSPAPSLVPSPAPPSAFQPTTQHHSYHTSNSSNPASRRQTPSPALSRQGSLAPQAPPSINYPQPPSDPRDRYENPNHSPHSSLSHHSTQSHQSYGASSVITKDTAISAISGTTATTSGSGIEPSVPPPMPMYNNYGMNGSSHSNSSQQQFYAPNPGSLAGGSSAATPRSPSPLGRIGQSHGAGSPSADRSTSQSHQGHHHQSYSSSSGGHRSVGEMQVPRFDKELPPVGSSRASVQSHANGTRRESPVPSLNINGSPHIPNGNGPGPGGVSRDSAFRQSRLIPAMGQGGVAGVSPSISQQSTATASTTGTSATVSSTGATTANSSPDPNGHGIGISGLSNHSPHASLTPHRSSSSMRNRGPAGPHQRGSPHQSMHSATVRGQFGPGGSSVKAHSTPSLVPSLGEDLDAFHVRNTYAQLEVSGVKGDGYEEGVERTRAARTRVASANVSPNPSVGDTGGSAEDGASPGFGKATRRTKSQVLADAAVADENEKKRELDPKEIQILSSLDRYGFFTVPSHDRLFSMPSQPFLKPLPFSPSAAASAGPPSPSAPSSPTPSASGNVSASPRTLSALPPVVTPGKENARIAKWGRMLIPHERDEGGNVQAWRIRPSKVNKLRRRTYKGIPDRWRAAAWEVLMTAYSSGSEEGGDGSRRVSGNAERNIGGVLVETTLRQASSASAASGGVREVRQTEREYRDNLEKPSSYDIQIDLDVPRTISGHIMFRTRYGAGQRSLFHVLHAFSLRCETCGYVQGMGPITATLLSYMSPSLAYTSLVRLHDAYSLHTVFSPGFPGLLEAIYVQERLTQVAMPGVYAAFQKNMISTTSYATKWYITLFANSVPFQTQLRLWDVFLLEGYDIYIAVAVAIVWVYRDHITSAAANFETVLSLLSGFFVPEDENVLLGWLEKMLGDKRIRSAMRGWRMEWRELVRQGKEGTALL